MSARAIVHEVGSRLAACELTFVERRGIDVARAREEHAGYCAALRSCGVHVNVLTGGDEHPDAVFVEDTAIVLDELAIVCPMGTPARRGEVAAVAAAVAQVRPLVRIGSPARLEGGDVLRVGRTLYVGRSSRTDDAGIAALRRAVSPHGYAVVAVDVHGSLHLKTACTALDESTLLCNPEWCDVAAFAGMEILEVPPQEPFGANTLRLGATTLVSASWPRTVELVSRQVPRTLALGISELEKAEAGLTCLSLLFEG